LEQKIIAGALKPVRSLWGTKTQRLQNSVNEKLHLEPGRNEDFRKKESQMKVQDAELGRNRPKPGNGGKRTEWKERLRWGDKKGFGSVLQGGLGLGKYNRV